LNDSIRFDLFDKRRDVRFTKIVSAALAKNCVGRCNRLAFLVGTVGGDCIEAVGNTDDFCTRWNFLGLQAKGITGAIFPFMMKQNEINRRFQKVDILEQRGTDQWMRADFLLKIAGQVGLPVGENPIVQGQLAHIMEQPPDTYVADIFLGKSHSSSQSHGIYGDPMAVGEGVPVFFPKGNGNFTQRLQVLSAKPFPVC
jgi:hypothetical protein